MLEQDIIKKVLTRYNAILLRNINLDYNLIFLFSTVKHWLRYTKTKRTQFSYERQYRSQKDLKLNVSFV